MEKVSDFKEHDDNFLDKCKKKSSPWKSLNFFSNFFSDITDVWDVENPADVLKQVLSNNGKEAPEFRLLWVNGQDTILSCYHIGVYSEKELLGQSPGETVDIAKDMAARDALRKLFNYDDCSTPIPFQILKSTKSELKLTSNQSVRDWSADHVKNIVTV